KAVIPIVPGMEGRKLRLINNVAATPRAIPSKNASKTRKPLLTNQSSCREIYRFPIYLTRYLRFGSA
ncbi:MAG: hypothetical protein WCA00_14635, partial [Candidatus Acidiferrales bacterium]